MALQYEIGMTGEVMSPRGGVSVSDGDDALPNRWPTGQGEYVSLDSSLCSLGFPHLKDREG